MSKQASLTIFFAITILLVLDITLWADRLAIAKSNPRVFPGGTSAGSESTNPAANTPDLTTSYTLEQVAEHSSENDCWTTVRGNVYNLTPFVREHPGGVNNIIKICGKDGTSMFTAQHGSQRDPNKELTTLQIGILKQ